SLYLYAFWIISYFNSFHKSVISLHDLFVRRVLCSSVRVTGMYFLDAIQFFSKSFYTPKTTTGKIDSFQITGGVIKVFVHVFDIFLQCITVFRMLLRNRNLFFSYFLLLLDAT